MGIGIVLFALAGIGGFLLLCSETKGSTLRVSGEVTPQDLSPEESRQLYRLKLFVHPQYQAKIKALYEEKGKRSGVSGEAFLSESMKPLALRLGFGPTLLVTHDPTDPSIWRLLTRRAVSAYEILPYARVLQMEAVEEPPPQARSTPLGLDKGLTEDEVWAVRHALSRDDDTKHLGGFSSTLDPDFPVAARLLEAKAILAALRSYRSPLGQGEGKDLSSLVTVLQKATSSLGEDVSRAWDKYRGLKVMERDQKTLGDVVQSLTEAFTSRNTRTPAALPSPAALQLALATRRPQLSLVEDGAQITQRLTEINRDAKAGNVNARKAQAKLEDATRVMERLQWVEWYKRNRKAENPQDPEPGSVTGGWSNVTSKGRMRNR
jgi:hypothetical protein